MATRFEALYDRRKGGYSKDAQDESFLRELNEYLEPRERELHGDVEIAAPFVFVARPAPLGDDAPDPAARLLPRRRLRRQLRGALLARARARAAAQPRAHAGGGAEPARVRVGLRAHALDLLGIHEFGYFWRHWLQQGDVRGRRPRARARGRDRLGRAAAARSPTCKRELGGKPFVAKNMLASYHLPTASRGARPGRLRLRRARSSRRRGLDPRRAAKVLRATRARGGATCRPRSRSCAGLDEWEQVAGQVHYLHSLLRARARGGGRGRRRPHHVRSSSAERPARRARRRSAGAKRRRRDRASPPTRRPVPVPHARGPRRGEASASPPSSTGSRPDDA